MKISVITVCWNSVGTVGAALASVAAQRHDDFEVEHVVVDGASTDGTADVVAAFRHAAPGYSYRWLSEKDRGMYDAINKGIALATGDVVGILNADDEFDGDDALASVAAAFRDAAVEGVYGDIRFARDDRTVRYYGARHWRPWMARWGYMVPHPSVYFRRDVFARLGGYRLGYDISADFELMVRYFVCARVPSVYLDRCLVKMRVGGKSTANWRAIVRLNCENVRALRENGIFSCLPMMLPKYAVKVLGLRRGYRA